MGKLQVKELFETVDLPYLFSKVADLKDEGMRLVQICATAQNEGACQLLYSFDGSKGPINFKVNLGPDDEVESITRIYWPAFVYENEIQDLYGITFRHSELDYEGTFMSMSMRISEREDSDQHSDEGREQE